MDIQAKVERYLARQGGDSAPVEIRRPQWGRNSEVFLLKDQSGCRSVLRAFGQVRPARRYVANLQRFGQRSLPLPALLGSDLSARTWLRYQRSFCIEEFAEGPLLVDAGITQDTLQTLLGALAALHEESSPHWGRPARPQRKDYRQALRNECDSQLSSIPTLSPLLQTGDAERFRSLLASTWDRLPEIDEFSLLHGKLGSDDVVISEDRKRATFIDLDGLNFGHFAHDLSAVLYDIAQADKGDEQRLVEHYLRCRSADVAEELALVSPFFRVRHHLRKIAVAHRRIAKEELTSHTRAKFHYAALVDLAHGI